VFWRVGTVVFPADTSFNPAKFIAEIKARKIEYLQLVPAVINPTYQAWDGIPITEPCVIVSTSAPTPPALRQKLAEMFPDSDIMIAAGLSESINMATQVPGELLVYPNSVGEPHIDTRLRILDDDDRPVPRNRQGHIVLRGFNTALRYNNNDEISAVTWRPIKGDSEGLHWCFTGDIGVMDDDGKVSIVDRSKDVIITGGETVPSVEIEAVYMEHPNIAECAAVGIEDEKWGEAILLVAAKSNPSVNDADLAADLYAYGRQNLAGYKVPKTIAFLDVLPRSHFGKILKRDLRSRQFERIF
jgi:acyl-CoA synthetase (AMP-forming)/AMP-acid ligase II